MKNFEQWRTKYAYVALAGDSIPATALANWILQQDPPLTQLPIQYESTTHMRTINTQALLSFITNGIHLTQFHTYNGRRGIEKADGTPTIAHRLQPITTVCLF